jgi:gliding-associated putative ABC transporter substrate-binding component GldG
MYSLLEAGNGNKPFIGNGKIMQTKKIQNRSEVLIYILSILGLFVVLNYVGTRWFKRLDMTEGKEYSISQATKTSLKSLNDIITVKVFFSKNLPHHLNKTVTDVKDILTEYQAYAGSNLNIVWQDPAEDSNAKEAAQSLGIPEIQLQTFEKDKAQVINGYLGIAVLYEDKKEILPVVQNLQNLEYDLTMAIMKVSRSSVPSIGIVKLDTLPELPPQFQNQVDQSEKTEQKFAPLYQRLRENYTVSTVDLSSGTPIDSTIKTLIVPGITNISDRKAYEIDQFFMKGGNLIVLADAVTVNLQYGLNATPQESKLLDALETYGVRVERNMILDASCGQVQIPQQVGPFTMNVAVPYPYFPRLGPASFNKVSPAVATLSDVIFPWISSLTLLVDKNESGQVDTAASKVQATVLAESSEKSWPATGYFDLNPQQQWNPPGNQTKKFTMAVYLNGDFKSHYSGKAIPSKNQPSSDDTLGQIKLQPDPEDANRVTVDGNNGGRLVVIGDADFVSGQNATPNNIAMMLNLVDWLSLDNNLIAIRTRSLKDRTIESDLLKEGSSKPGIIRLVNIFIMPVILIAIGLFIFMRRREPVTATVVSTEKTEVSSK